MILSGIPSDDNPAEVKTPSTSHDCGCSWNVWGLNSLVKCRAMLDFLSMSFVDFCYLLETRSSGRKFLFYLQKVW